MSSKKNLNNPLRNHIYLSVQSLKKFMVLVLVALWSLASNHCKLEQLTAFEFLQCGDMEAVAAHPESDCATDGCATLEGSIYKTEESQLATVAPLLAEIPGTSIASDLIPSPPKILFVPASLPPELFVGWQFISRTAASPRAPSFVS